MNSFFEKYSTDRVAEEEGQWVEFGGGVEVQVRRLNCDKSKKVRRKLEKPYVKRFRNMEMPDDIQELLLNQQIAKAVVVAWKGVPNPDNPSEWLACTEDNVLRMVNEFPDFRDEILQASMERATFQNEDLKAAEGNSQTFSDGSSDQNLQTLT